MVSVRGEVVRLVWFLFVFFIGFRSFAETRYLDEEFGSLSIGHNLSTNSRTLEKGQWSLGVSLFGLRFDGIS